MPAVGGRAASQVDEDIQHAPGLAVDQLVVRCRRNLEVHAAQHPPARLGVEGFAVECLQAGGFEGLSVVGLDEAAPRVLETVEVNQQAARKVKRIGTHAQNPTPKNSSSRWAMKSRCGSPSPGKTPSQNVRFMTMSVRLSEPLTRKLRPTM